MQDRITVQNLREARSKSLKLVSNAKKVTNSDFFKKEKTHKLIADLNSLFKTNGMKLVAEISGENIKVFNLQSQRPEEFKDLQHQEVTNRLETLSAFLKSNDSGMAILDKFLAATSLSLTDLIFSTNPKNIVKVFFELLNSDSVTLSPAQDDSAVFQATYSKNTLPVYVTNDTLVTNLTTIDFSPTTAETTPMHQRQNDLEILFTTTPVNLKDALIITSLHSANMLKDERNINSDEFFMGYSVEVPLLKNKRQRFLGLSYEKNNGVLYLSYYDKGLQALSKYSI